MAVAAVALAVSGCSGAHVRLIEKSMEPTVRSGELVDLDEWAYDDTNPGRGDIISFAPPEGADDFSCEEPPFEDSPCGAPSVPGEGTSLIKRVIAIPGDTVAIASDGRVILNGEHQDEDYVIPCREEDECGLPDPITVPTDNYFVMGDNRPYSGDSRHFGPIYYASVEGKVTPPER
jgi:signal peptidase I